MNAKNAERIADVFAMVSFSYVTGMFIEVFIAGMTVSQSLVSRNASIPLNLLSARFFGVYRNALTRLFRANNAFRRVAVDFIAFVSFQIPIYIAVLLFAGANTQQIITSVSGVIVLFIFLGPPYGYYLDFCRRASSRFLLKQS